MQTRTLSGQGSFLGPATNTVDCAVLIHPSCLVTPCCFIGNGVQWDAYHPGEERWAEVLRRVDFMRPALLRVMIAFDWVVKGWGPAGPQQLHWEHPDMLQTFRILDYAQAKGISVIFGMWSAFGAGIPGGHHDAERSSRAAVDIVKHLVRDRHYSCIRWLNLHNEPNGGWSWHHTVKAEERHPCWLAVVKLTAQRLREEQLPVQLIGPGTCTEHDGEEHWMKRGACAAPADCQGVLGAYSIHIYAFDEKLAAGQIEQLVQQRRRQVDSDDAGGYHKPLLLGEAGMLDGRISDTQTRRHSPAYAISMAALAVQAMRGGCSGVCAWNLDDAMHTGGGYGSKDLKGWGLWNSWAGRDGYHPHDFNIRPWFRAWSVLCRSFPAGCQILHVDVYPPVPGLHITAIRTAHSTTAAIASAQPTCPADALHDISIAAVNNTPQPRSVLLKLPVLHKGSNSGSGSGSSGSGKLLEFHFTGLPHAYGGDDPHDGQGMPVPAAEVTGADFTKGVTLVLPASSCVILTSLVGGQPLALAALGNGLSVSGAAADYQLHTTTNAAPLGKDIFLQFVSNHNFVTIGEAPGALNPPGALNAAQARVCPGPIGRNQAFKVVDGGDAGTVSLLSLLTGAYLAAPGDGDHTGPCSAASDAIGPAERWHWEDSSDGRIALRSALNSKYLNVDPHATAPPLCARGLSVRQWERMCWGEVAWL